MRWFHCYHYADSDTRIKNAGLFLKSSNLTPTTHINLISYYFRIMFIKIIILRFFIIWHINGAKYEQVSTNWYVYLPFLIIPCFEILDALLEAYCNLLLNINLPEGPFTQNRFYVSIIIPLSSSRSSVQWFLAILTDSRWFFWILLWFWWFWIDYKYGKSLILSVNGPSNLPYIHWEKSYYTEKITGSKNGKSLWNFDKLECHFWTELTLIRN